MILRQINVWSLNDLLMNAVWVSFYRMRMKAFIYKALIIFCCNSKSICGWLAQYLFEHVERQLKIGIGTTWMCIWMETDNGKTSYMSVYVCVCVTIWIGLENMWSHSYHYIMRIEMHKSFFSWGGFHSHSFVGVYWCILIFWH